jgi:uncharacterized repeat protein (TIGR03803 family)
MRGFNNLFSNLSGTLAFLLLVAVFVPLPAFAATFQIDHSFCGCDGEGWVNYGGIFMDPSANIYGTTTQGGAKNFGTVYWLSKGNDGTWTDHTLYSFCQPGPPNCTDGSEPTAPPIEDTAGNLYGTTHFGGNGTEGGYEGDGVVYELIPDSGRTTWTYKLLHKFCSEANCIDGQTPYAKLTYAGEAEGQLYDGKSPLFGVASGGGKHLWGTIFKLQPVGGAWQETVLHNFCSNIVNDICRDGMEPGPGAPLVMNSKGVLFGTTIYGGAGKTTAGDGVIFRLRPHAGGWVFNALYRFCAEDNCIDGLMPYGGVVLRKDRLYGTTVEGGAYGGGTVYEFRSTKAGRQLTVLYNFCKLAGCADGAAPWAQLTLDNSGNLYGTTHYGGGYDYDIDGGGGGVAFEISKSTYTKLYSFCSVGQICADGAYPQGGVVLGPSNHLFGPTQLGGKYQGGEVFEITP